MSSPSGMIVLSIGVVLISATTAGAAAAQSTGSTSATRPAGPRELPLAVEIATAPAPDPCGTLPCDRQEPSPPKREERVKRHLPFSFGAYWVIDALWMPTSTGDHTVGLIGGHLAIAQVGRVYVYGPPGLIVLRADTENGRAFQTAYTWGFSIFVTDFTVTGTKRRASFFVNLAKAWTSGTYYNGTNMAGVSVSFQLRK